MALAGADRIIRILDEKPELDEGYVTLVNAEIENGEVREAQKHTGHWAWKHYHKADNTTTYQPLEGDVVFNGVDFGYDEKKMVLHDIKLFAKPGQKIAFVGSTGAGKTTITNLINRFYDIQDGKIRYDGINICVGLWGLFFRIRSCLRIRLWKISVTESWMLRMKR